MMNDKYQPKQSIVKGINDKLYLKLNSKLEDLLIEGLKRKGFEFENKLDLENFVKTRCRVTDNISFKERIYYVDDIPFFLHKYEMFWPPITQEDMSNKIAANFGSYAYL